jgi:hypothetical protein
MGLPVIEEPLVLSASPRLVREAGQIQEDGQRFAVKDGVVRLDLSLYSEAEAAVVGPSPKRGAARFAPASSIAPAAVPAALKQVQKRKAQDAKAKDKARHVDPREWERPAVRKDEAKQAYEERLRKWERTRAKVAMRLGVSLTGAAKGGTPKK